MYVLYVHPENQYEFLRGNSGFGRSICPNSSRIGMLTFHNLKLSGGASTNRLQNLWDPKINPHHE